MAFVKPCATGHEQESRHRKYLETLSEYSILQIYETRSNAVILYDTLPAEFIDQGSAS